MTSFIHEKRQALKLLACPFMTLARLASEMTVILVGCVSSLLKIFLESWYFFLHLTTTWLPKTNI